MKTTQSTNHPKTQVRWPRLMPGVWLRGALPGVASKGLSTGPEMVPFCARRRRFIFMSCVFSCVFVYVLLTSVFRHPACIFTMHKYRPMTSRKTKIHFLSCQSFCWGRPTLENVHITSGAELHSLTRSFQPFSVLCKWPCVTFILLLLCQWVF